MLSKEFRLINEEFYAESVLPEQMDSLWANGWRHFGKHFFRYNVGFFRNELRYVLPLRIDLARFEFSKGQRRNLRRNSDLSVVIGPIDLTPEANNLFELHKTRFEYGAPDSIFTFLSSEPANSPCAAKEICVYEEDRLLAVSYFDVGSRSVSGVYAMFDPAITHRGLGIFTMLKEIEYSIETNRQYYYQGYAYEGESFYDYKKRFRATEVFDWDGSWVDF
ncbi:hypothetical protein [Leptolyngbya sp. 7M]|uniref:hypothetical protein n=1 Tax=Leptolyngbya sp. 7M TaxID=2812896 RepID=UPI001B8C3D39|nr:hypothetical protein [Leptolyngbya sp. 7M]QYO66108.1 hypothetical protein JVX88_04725 [Leptolyngbya sp. 7M]